MNDESAGPCAHNLAARPSCARTCGRLAQREGPEVSESQRRTLRPWQTPIGRVPSNRAANLVSEPSPGRMRRQSAGAPGSRRRVQHPVQSLSPSALPEATRLRASHKEKVDQSIVLRGGRDQKWASTSRTSAMYIYTRTTHVPRPTQVRTVERVHPHIARLAIPKGESALVSTEGVVRPSAAGGRMTACVIGGAFARCLVNAPARDGRLRGTRYVYLANASTCGRLCDMKTDAAEM